MVQHGHMASDLNDGFGCPPTYIIEIMLRVKFGLSSYENLPSGPEMLIYQSPC